MFSSYKVLPMAADGDIYALLDSRGNQVAMGTREVCQTLLFLVTSSPLMAEPSRHFERVAPGQRARSVAAAEPLGMTSGIGAERPPAERKVLGAHPAVRLRESGGEADAEPYGILELIYLGSRAAASYWYLGLPVVILLGSVLLMWSLSLNK